MATANRNRTQQRRNAAAAPPAKAAPRARQRPAPEPEEEDEEQFEEDEEEETPAPKGRKAKAEPEDDDRAPDDDDEEYDDDELPEVFDLSAVPDDPGYEVLPAGTYDGTVEEVRYERSQASGNPMLTWVLKVQRPEGGEATLFYHTTLAGKGLSRTKRTLGKLDPELDLSDFRPDEADENFGGMEIRAKVRIQNYQGEKRNGVADLLPAEDYTDE